MSLLKCPEWSFSAPDGVVLQAYKNEVLQPRAVLVWMHGHGDWSGTLSEFAHALEERNVLLAAWDFRGHGMSSGRRGVVASYTQLIEDAVAFVQVVQKSCANIPMVLGGHSMGGGLAARLLQDELVDCQAAVLWAPWLHLTRSFGLLRGLIKFGACCFPGVTVLNGISPKQRVRDLNLAQRMLTDSLRHERISWRLLEGSLSNGEYCLKHSRPLHLAVAVWHGSDDNVTCRNASRLWAEQSGADYYILPNIRHDLHWDVGQAEMAGQVVAWLINQKVIS